MNRRRGDTSSGGPTRVANLTRESVLATNARVARSWWARGKGLLGRRELPAGEGLVIEPCASIHTWFMAFPIDVAFIARDGRVVRVAHALQPWRVGPFARGAHAAIELPAGTLRRTGTVEGDYLALESADGRALAP